MIEYLIDMYYVPPIKKKPLSITQMLIKSLSRKRIFNNTPHVVWGNTSGWRVRTNGGVATSILPEMLDNIMFDDENSYEWDLFYGD